MDFSRVVDFISHLLTESRKYQETKPLTIYDYLKNTDFAVAS